MIYQQDTIISDYGEKAILNTNKEASYSQKKECQSVKHAY